MEQTSALARDLTDSDQNEAVLTGTGNYGPAVAAEAAAVARSRERLRAVTGPVHLTVVWAMYGETGRIVPRSEHPHGEDFVRAKVRQLDWLTEGLPDVTWSILACDDGCPDEPSSADVMAGIIEAEGYPSTGHRSVRVIKLADLLGTPISPEFAKLTSTDQSRKGGSILAALATAVDAGPEHTHVVAYTDADLSANLAQLGSLIAPIVDGSVATLGQRYGVEGAVLVKPDGPSVEPQSTGDKPDKLIVLFRHYVRALLIPSLAHVLDTQAGFKVFDAAALRPVLAEMTSFNETFDVELLIHLAQRYGAGTLAVEPIVFTEDFAATNFPSVDPGARHLAMVKQVVELYDRFVEPVEPVTGEAAELLTLVRDLDLDGYVRLIGKLRADDAGDPTLFDRRWSVEYLRSAV
ncbi:hypothetical protein [Cryptosporangium sp. NPDC048952]|uniref:hypothetical protein n=1 Tax=Cryptosporangium sp. NPDC048952 TaxID=3363961 RepID=UPI003712F181